MDPIQCLTPTEVADVLHYFLDGVLEWFPLTTLPLAIIPALFGGCICGGDRSHLIIPILLTMAWTIIGLFNLINFYEQPIDPDQLLQISLIIYQILFAIEGLFLARHALMRLQSAITCASTYNKDSVHHKLVEFQSFAKSGLILITGMMIPAVAGTFFAQIHGANYELDYLNPLLSIFPVVIMVIAIVLFYLVELYKTDIHGIDIVPGVPNPTGKPSKFSQLLEILSLSAYSMKGRSQQTRSARTNSARTNGPTNVNQVTYIYSPMDYLSRTWRFSIMSTLFTWCLVLILNLIMDIPLAVLNLLICLRMLQLLICAVLYIACERVRRQRGMTTYSRNNSSLFSFRLWSLFSRSNSPTEATVNPRSLIGTSSPRMSIARLSTARLSTGRPSTGRLSMSSNIASVKPSEQQKFSIEDITEESQSPPVCRIDVESHLSNDIQFNERGVVKPWPLRLMFPARISSAVNPTKHGKPLIFVSSSQWKQAHQIDAPDQGDDIPLSENSKTTTTL